MQHHCLFTVRDFFVFANLHQTKQTGRPFKIKIVLSKDILRTFANGVEPDQTLQNAEFDQVHHCFLNEQKIV